MVFLKRNTSASARKKLPPPTPPLTDQPPPPPPPPPKYQETLQQVTRGGEVEQQQQQQQQNDDIIGTVLSVLADAGCTLCTIGPPSLLSHPHKFRRRLESRFSADPSLLPRFLSSLSHYIRDTDNLRRILIPVLRDDGGGGLSQRESLVRLLLLVPPLQLQLQLLLLEKLPEHFDDQGRASSSCSSLQDDVARLIVNQFLWLDFLVDPDGFSDKLLEVLGICPLPLKKEIIGALPEIIGDRSNAQVVTVLEQMLQDDLEVIVPVLDSLSNLNLVENLQDQAITIALSCIRTVDMDHMPHLLRYLLLSATPKNIQRIIAHIRQQVQFISMPDPHTARNKKLKGKSTARSAEASILEALESSLRFKNMICEEVLKELKSLQEPHGHKVIDIWLLILVYKNGGSLQKNAEKVLKKKIVEGSFRKSLFDQCIHGHREIVKSYFATYLSFCEYLLACKENQAREFAVHVYVSLFEEFSDTHSRQEILDALMTHMGTGVGYEVNSALEIMILLTTKYSKELIPVASHINGILDYLEGFHDENLHTVYEVFCQLALSSDADSNSSSIANELLMIVRKQVGNPDMRYKKMGVVGTLKIISKLGDINAATKFSPSKKSNSEEVLELLTMSLDSCKPSTLSLILLYDELIALLGSTILQPAILEWLGKHAGEFESNFLSDIDAGRLPSRALSICLEGELWMNLDGDVSPICLDILQLLFSSQKQCSASLQILPVQFLLLSAIERSANQDSLGGIDALLGCPIHLPSPRYFSESRWSSLTGTQKTMVSLSLFYALNWIRELLNAFSTQVSGKLDCITQSTKEEMVIKLLKRLRNLICMESLLNLALKQYPVTLPELHNYVEYCGSPYLCNSHHTEKKRGSEAPSEENPSSKKKSKKKSKASENLDANEKLRQPTILEMLKKAGATVSQEIPAEGPGSSSCRRMSQAVGHEAFNFNEVGIMDVSAVPLFLEGQKFKFRPLRVDCLSLLCFSQGQDSCCSDSAAELPLHLYLLRDFHYKLDYLSSSGRQLMASHALKASPGLNRLTIFEFLEKIGPLFPSLRKHLDVAICVLQEGAETCQDHWKFQSASAGNPDTSYLQSSKVSAAEFVCKEVLFCFGKLLKCPELFLHVDKLVLKNLLQAFQLSGKLADTCLDIQPPPAHGSIDYLYCRTYGYFENIVSIACTLSFSLASEVLFTLESIVKSISHFLDKLPNGNGKNTCIGISHGIYPYLQKRLGTSAHNLLVHDWHNDENIWKSKGDVIQKIAHIYLNNNESTPDLLVDLACSVLPQVSDCNSKSIQDVVDGIPTLCSVSFVNWYRVLHEENIAALNKLIIEVTTKSTEVQCQTTGEVLVKLRQFVDVVVSLVSLCKTHDKVTVHAMAIKYGGKFVDIFLKAFDFLEAHFQAHNDTIIQMVKELQKATRIIQTLCSEAKVSKRTMVTSKIPAIKRSLERFLFCVKALLHITPNKCTFWMGSLRHKDLLGQVVSSQAYTEADDGVVEERSPEGADQMDALF